MTKRGISALIAVVLILGFTIAVGSVVLTWGGGFIKNLQESTERSAEKQMTCSSDVRLDIRKVKFLGNKVELLIENVGKIDIEKFYVRVYGTEGVDSIEVNSSLPIFGISNYEVEFDPGKTGFVEKIEVFPSIVYGNEIVSCSNVKAREEMEYSISCLNLLQREPILGSGVYTIDSDGDGDNEPFEVYCDMESDGGGWTLIARTGNTCDGHFGWNYAIGSLNDLSSCYSLGVGNNGLSFNEIIWGINLNNFEWGDYVYKAPMTEQHLITYSDSMGPCSTPIPVKGGNTGNIMQGCKGYTNRDSIFYMRDCCGYSNHGMHGTHFVSTYCSDDWGGYMCNQKAMLFVR